LDKTFPLIDGVVQLGETVCDLSPGDEKLKSVYYLRVLAVPARERGDPGGVMGDKSGLNEMRLNQFFIEIVENLSMGGSPFEFKAEALGDFNGLERDSL
jgi:hypothetical protein